MPAGTRLASRGSVRDRQIARCLADIAQPIGHLKAPGRAVHVDVTDASGPPVAEAPVYMVADSASYAPATRERPLHGRAYHHDATTSGFGNVRVAANPVGRIRVCIYATGGKLHTSEASVAEGQRLRLAIRLP